MIFYFEERNNHQTLVENTLTEEFSTVGVKYDRLYSKTI